MTDIPGASDRHDVFGSNSRFGGVIEPEKPKGNFLTKDRKMTVTYNPWRGFKRVVGVVLLVSIFLVGSWMATSACWSSDPSTHRWCFSPFDSDDSVTAHAVSNEPVVPVSEPVVAAPVVVAESTPEPVVNESVQEEVKSEPVEAEPTVAPTPAAPVVEEPEAVVTHYESDKVILTLDKVTSTSMGSWGKVDRLDVSIANQEGGTIIPSKIIMVMEGYDKRTKEVFIPENIAAIRSGKMIRPSLQVDGGFSYNGQQVGDLNDVRIDLTMVDSSGKLMATMSRYVKLN